LIISGDTLVSWLV